MPKNLITKKPKMTCKEIKINKLNNYTLQAKYFNKICCFYKKLFTCCYEIIGRSCVFRKLLEE